MIMQRIVVTLTLVALILAVLILAVGPFATPLYATTHVEVKMFEIAAGDFVERFLQMPLWLAAAIVLALLIVAIYLEYFAKIEVGKLPKITSVLALLYSVPLPYVYVVGGGNVVVVLSNFAKFVSLPLFGVALLTTIVETIFIPKRRAKVIADLSITEEKTERGT
jgi:uncharacterized membrane protein